MGFISTAHQGDAMVRGVRRISHTSMHNPVNTNQEKCEAEDTWNQTFKSLHGTNKIDVGVGSAN